MLDAAFSDYKMFQLLISIQSHIKIHEFSDTEKSLSRKWFSPKNDVFQLNVN